MSEDPYAWDENEPSHVCRQISEQVAQLLPGQPVVVLPSKIQSDQTLLFLPYRCPDCQCLIPLRLHLFTVELPLMLNHPRILQEVIEIEILKNHP